MLKANKSVIFEKLFAIYNRNLLKRRFHSMKVSGLDFLFDKNIKLPLIIYCNHSSWWDGLIAFQISFETRLNSFVMMEEKQLKNLFLFRKLGAFSVVREKPREAMQSIRYASGILNDYRNSTLWIFPQGEILPNDLRPLKFYNGLSKIIKNVKNCETTSLSIRYEFLGEFKPEIFVKIEKPLITSTSETSNSTRLSEILAQRLTVNLDSLKVDLVNQNLSAYKSIL